MAVSAFNNPAKKRELLKLYKQGSLTPEPMAHGGGVGSMFRRV